MADKKFEYVPFVTEIMTARYPHLSEPDTRSEYADGKYKTEAVASEAFRETFQAQILAVGRAAFPRNKNVHLPWKETKEGDTAFNFKSPRKQPALVDAKGAPLRPGIVIRGGSLIRIAGSIAAWEKGIKRGLSLWPDAVRVIKLAEGFDASAAFGPPEDGFDNDGLELRSDIGDGCDDPDEDGSFNL